MDTNNQSNGGLEEEVNGVANDSVITTISLDTTAGAESSGLNDTATIELGDDVEEVDGSASVIICSSPINKNENASDEAQMDGITSVTHDEAAPDIDENTALFRLEFENEDIFEELATMISSRIREALVSLDKTVTVMVDKENNRITFSKANDGDVFMIDTLPTDKVHKSEVPSYKSVTEALKKMNANKKDATNDANDKPKTGGCWNCGGDHNMRECKEPVNRENIARRKQMFHRTKTERYHLDAEQKFANFVPGTISDNLREGLGLRQRELPLYIYKMRLYGYPPGWLEEAKVTRSGLTLFNAEVSHHRVSPIDEVNNSILHLFSRIRPYLIQPLKTEKSTRSHLIQNSSSVILDSMLLCPMDS